MAHWSPLTLMHLAGAALYAGTAITLFFLGRSTQAVVALICAGGGAAFALARFTRSKAR
ncbi:hypothetical protein [Virgisporangium aurantiacum]|uniref:hypothetical protein n=1 Tax=Virgisporangium aurantiacum TaxID=175570 RepID=UPI001950E813|nr:hypothetical protein [Virgisporangium aurantiacum]